MMSNDRMFDAEFLTEYSPSNIPIIYTVSSMEESVGLKVDCISCDFTPFIYESCPMSVVMPCMPCLDII